MDLDKKIQEFIKRLVKEREKLIEFSGMEVNDDYNQGRLDGMLVSHERCLLMLEELERMMSDE